MLASKKFLLISIVALVLAVTLLATGVFAWFSMNNSNKANDFALQVVSNSGEGVEVSIVEGSTLPDGAVGILYPGDFVLAKLDVSNLTEVRAALRVSILQVFAYYTLGQTDAEIDDTYIVTKQYYNNATSTPFDETSVLSKKDFFKSFIAPFTNALQYALYTEEQNFFEDDYTPSYLTALPNATDAELSSTSSTLIAEDIPLNVIDNSSGTPTVQVNESGTITLDPSETATLWLVLYFDPQFYPTAQYEGNTYRMENSNAYAMQQIKVKLGV